MSKPSWTPWHQVVRLRDDLRTGELALNEFAPDSADDMDRLEELRADAVEYLTRNFSYRIPEDVAHGMPARDLLLLASSRGKKQTDKTQPRS